MKKIVITGNIGSGKTFVCEVLKERGANVLDLDQVAKDVRNGIAKKEIIELFGSAILFKGEIDPIKLRAIVFHDDIKLKQLEHIIHPYVLKVMLDTFKHSKSDVFVEMALVFEKGWQSYFDEIWFVKSEEEISIKRLVQYRNYTKEEAQQILAHQIKYENHMDEITHVILNNGNREDIHRQLEKLF